MTQFRHMLLIVCLNLLHAPGVPGQTAPIREQAHRSDLVQAIGQNSVSGPKEFEKNGDTLAELDAWHAGIAAGKSMDFDKTERYAQLLIAAGRAEEVIGLALRSGYWNMLHESLTRSEPDREVLRVFLARWFVYGRFGITFNEEMVYTQLIRDARAWREAMIVLSFRNDSEYLEYFHRMSSRLAFPANSARERILQAEALRYFDLSEDAWKIYDELTGEFPQSTFLYCHRTMARLEQGDLAGAQKELSKLRRIDSNSPWGYAAEGAICQAKGDWPAALDAFDQAFKRNPYIFGLSGRKALIRCFVPVEQWHLPSPGNDSEQATNASNVSPEIDFEGELRFGYVEFPSLSAGFPWRLPESTATQERQETGNGPQTDLTDEDGTDAPSPLATARVRLARGDVLGGVEAMKALRDLQLPPRSLTPMSQAAIACESIGDYGSARTYAGTVRVDAEPRYRGDFGHLAPTRPEIRLPGGQVQVHKNALPSTHREFLNWIITPIETRLEMPRTLEDLCVSTTRLFFSQPRRQGTFPAGKTPGLTDWEVSAGVSYSGQIPSIAGSDPIIATGAYQTGRQHRAIGLEQRMYFATRKERYEARDNARKVAQDNRFARVFRTYYGIETQQDLPNAGFARTPEAMCRGFATLRTLVRCARDILSNRSRGILPRRFFRLLPNPKAVLST